MKISYKWLSEYLPVNVAPERLATILTSIGLEVESLEKFEEVKGGLRGLIIGQVLSAEKHPNADKLTLTRVDIANGEPLQIVCGAPNVAAGQKVIVAVPGTTIYPAQGDPFTIKVAKIRGIESRGMICAEDEISLGNDHSGILVLPPEIPAGSLAADYFRPYQDWVFEIGLTPNRMDAMSHWGVARDVCAYLSHHEKKEVKPLLPEDKVFKTDNHSLPIKVIIENKEACKRYSGISLSGITVKESPRWLQQKLKAIGQRPINNIVDITNFIQHETGQPLHAFDADKIKGKTIIVKNLPQDTPFVTLDGKERKLNAADLMICDAEEPVCIAGVFGGIHSGVTEESKNIFLESAWFNPQDIRKTSFAHGLRTDAATRFEKGTDISNTVNVLKRAALMIREIAGGKITSDITDVYPVLAEKNQVSLSYPYLKKLSGKNYHSETVVRILSNLGFEINEEHADGLRLAVPFHKPDITHPADVVEEVLRIDGLDNIEIPESITISPSGEENHLREALREKISAYLAGIGFSEIMTNPITHSAYFGDEEKKYAVRMINNLSAELDMMRPSLLETGLVSVAYNLNRKNSDLKFFEFGKTYRSEEAGKYEETEHLCLYITGNTAAAGWKAKPAKADIYFLKGIIQSVLSLAGIKAERISDTEDPKISPAQELIITGKKAGVFGCIKSRILQQFDIKQPVLFVAVNWQIVTEAASSVKIKVKEIPRFPPVQRDLAMIIEKQIKFAEVEELVQKLKLDKLHNVNLFDIFENEKMGNTKKSIALSFTFLDEEKTLTDREVDEWMSRISAAFEKELKAEIRK